MVSVSGLIKVAVVAITAVSALACGGSNGVSDTCKTSCWHPTAAHSLRLQWVLDGPLDVRDPVQMGLRDLNRAVLSPPDVYDIDGELNSAATVRYLHGQHKKVICYIDAGVYESYRADAASFPKSLIGKNDEGWAGSRWLDIRRVDALRPIMQRRIEMCRSKGFDGVEPDEIDGWENGSGFPLTYADQVRYDRAVAGWIHAAGLAAIQKGDIVQTADLVSYFDASLNEQCFEYDECARPWNPVTKKYQQGLQAYVARNKAVWIAEYKAYDRRAWESICATSRAQHWNTSVFRLGLPNDGGSRPCTGGW